MWAVERCGQKTSAKAIRISPFHSVGPVSFGMGVADIAALLGNAVHEGLSLMGLLELTFPSGYYRFNADRKLVEVTTIASSFELDGVLVPASFLDAYVRRRDRFVFTRSTFVISPLYGMAFSLDSPTRVTCFPQDSLKLWLSI